MAEDMEVSEKEAERLAASGSDVYVLIENFGDVDLVKEVLKSRGKTEEIDFGEAKTLVMGLGEPDDIKDLAKKYDNSIIVCPHGNTSLRMAKALQNLGVTAYSLKGGLAGLRSR